MHYRARLIATAVLACASLSSAECVAAPAYYFNWYCPGCYKVGSGSNGREGPFASHAACEAARATLGGSLNQRGCGPGCFYPQLCQFEGPPDAPAVRQVPAFPPASVHTPAAPGYDVGGARRAEQARREREQAAREAQARSGGDAPAAAPPECGAP